MTVIPLEKMVESMKQKLIMAMMKIKKKKNTRDGSLLLSTARLSSPCLQKRKGGEQLQSRCFEQHAQECYS